MIILVKFVGSDMVNDLSLSVYVIYTDFCYIKRIESVQLWGWPTPLVASRYGI